MSGNKGGNGVDSEPIPKMVEDNEELESKKKYRENKNTVIAKDNGDLQKFIQGGGVKGLAKMFGGGLEEQIKKDEEDAINAKQEAFKEEFKKIKELKEEAERKAKEEAERKAKEEADRKAKEEADRKAKEEADRKAKEEADRKAKEEADRKAKEEADRKAKEEAERKAKEEAERKAKEEAERKAKEEADRKAKEEADRKAKEEAERKAKEEAERKAKEEADRKAKEEADRKAKEEADRKAKEEADRKAKEEAAATQTHTTKTPNPTPVPLVPTASSWTFVKGPHSVIGEDDALTRLLKHIKAHPEAQNYKSIVEFQNTDLPLQTSKMVADTATQIPLRDLEFSKRQEKGQTVYDVTLPNDKYTGPVFMPRLDENGLQAKMEDGKPAYDILYYNDGNLDPNQSFVAPEGTPPKGAKSTIKSEDREKILEASKERDIQKQAVRMTQLLAGGPGGNTNSNTTPRVSSTRFYPPGR